MKSLRPLAAALMLALPLTLAATTPSEADDLHDRIAALPGAVEDVRIVGNWMRGDAAGSYRVVVARTGAETLTARLFVQWLVYGPGDPTIQATTEIAELAALHVDIADFTAESDADGLAMFVETMAPGGLSDQLYEIYITAPDDYRFGPASN